MGTGLLSGAGWSARVLPPLAVLLVAGLMALPQARAGDDPRSTLSLKDLQGHRVRLSDYRNQVVLLNFWATWCPPCLAEMPLLVQAQKDYTSKGVVVIGASVDDKDTRKNVPGFARKHHLDFPIWVGASPGDLKRLGLGEAIPATVFIDRDGRAVSRILGQMRDHEIRDRLDWLTGDRSGPPPETLVTHLGPGP